MPSIVLMLGVDSRNRWGGNLDEVMRQAKVGIGERGLAAALAIGLAASAASAQIGPGRFDPTPDARGMVHCPLVVGVDDERWPAGAPPALVADFARVYAPYAAPGEPYDATGGLAGPERRVMLARHKGGYWVVVYEQGAHGPRGRSVHMLLYRVEPSGRVTLLDAIVSFDGVLCSSSAALLQRYPDAP